MMSARSFAWILVFLVGCPHRIAAQSSTSKHCGYDGGDCFPDCTGYLLFIGDGYCDNDLNNEECGYDGGDCCRCTCDSPGVIDNCGYYGYDCLDPDAPTDCESASPTSSPAAALGYPDCTGAMSGLQNGHCDLDLNNEESGYDGGDCCSCTCEDGIYYTCGTYGYDCLDPNADNCPAPRPTPTPAADLDYPNCTGAISYLQNGYCDWDLNNEECGHDGGDCCSCTCEDGVFYTCDPTVPSDCEPLSSTPSPAAGLGYPDCTGAMSYLQDGYCDSDLNNAEYGYDGGDCCACSCKGDSCGPNLYTCLDPDPCPSDGRDGGSMVSNNVFLFITAATMSFIACLGIGCGVLLILEHVEAKRPGSADHPQPNAA